MDGLKVPYVCVLCDVAGHHRKLREVDRSISPDPSHAQEDLIPSAHQESAEFPPPPNSPVIVDGSTASTPDLLLRRVATEVQMECGMEERLEEGMTHMGTGMEGDVEGTVTTQVGLERLGSTSDALA
ncbi:hypothetical protein HK102_009716 [Quaeritorhiza haematococci]|nr:hypothetical protein HK102_009716 [Quaeritorhiza haematococci]